VSGKWWVHSYYSCSSYKNKTERSAREKNQVLATAEPQDLHRSHFLCHIKKCRRQQQYNSEERHSDCSDGILARQSGDTQTETDTLAEIETETADGQATDGRTGTTDGQGRAMRYMAAGFSSSDSIHLKINTLKF